MRKGKLWGEFFHFCRKSHKAIVRNWHQIVLDFILLFYFISFNFQSFSNHFRPTLFSYGKEYLSGFFPGVHPPQNLPAGINCFDGWLKSLFTFGQKRLIFGHEVAPEFIRSVLLFNKTLKFSKVEEISRALFSNLRRSLLLLLLLSAQPCSQIFSFFSFFFLSPHILQLLNSTRKLPNLI